MEVKIDTKKFYEILKMTLNTTTISNDAEDKKDLAGLIMRLMDNLSEPKFFDQVDWIERIGVPKDDWE
ncbi:hypothetical protein LCGC14_0266920 [marine sediment metagenome]|uniref:Uncharacterized protein n=1 Tax=marine sediment metagenome TaxID=412755 RepID=A0A0F9WKI0_9ZZZZ